MLVRKKPNKKVHGFGAIPSKADKRDFNYSDHIACAMEEEPDLPDSYETEYPEFVYDQGTSNMCVACSLALIRFIQTYRQNGQELNFDPLFIYANRNMLPDENMYIGEGMSVRDALKIIHNFGDSLWNDSYSGYFSYAKSVNIFNAHKDTMIPQASPYRIDSYYAVKGASDIKTAVMNFGAVSAMFPIYKCLKNPIIKDGKHYIKFSMLDRAQKYDGYHQMTIIGWVKDYWIVQNSWGREYGDKGKVFIPMNYPIMEAWTTLDYYDETREDIVLKK